MCGSLLSWSWNAFAVNCSIYWSWISNAAFAGLGTLQMLHKPERVLVFERVKRDKSQHLLVWVSHAVITVAVFAGLGAFQKIVCYSGCGSWKASKTVHSMSCNASNAVADCVCWSWKALHGGISTACWSCNVFIFLSLHRVFLCDTRWIALGPTFCHIAHRACWKF